jgi:hypothetical protein
MSLLTHPLRKAQPRYETIRGHPSRVIEVASSEIRDRMRIPLGGRRDELQTTDDETPHRVLEASIRRARYRGSPFVLPGSVLRTGFRILSGSSWPRRCIGCEAEGPERS